jgi:hypothetical protein
MFYLEINYVTKKLAEPYKNFTEVLIDSEVMPFCNKVLTDSLSIKNRKVDEPLIIGVQQQIVLDCFRYLLCTKYKDMFNQDDIIFYIDGKEVIFSEELPWKVIINNIWCQNLYGDFTFGIALSE